MTERQLIAVVDDDESLRESLPDLLRELGFAVQAFASGDSFLSSPSVERTACVILDIAMPGKSGLEVHEELKVRKRGLPVIFITAHGDPNIRPHLMQQGAVEVLFKPFTEAALLDALNAALRRQ